MAYYKIVGAFLFGICLQVLGGFFWSISLSVPFGWNFAFGAWGCLAFGAGIVVSCATIDFAIRKFQSK